MANLGTKASGETSRPNFEPMQITVVQFATDASGSFGANWWPNLRLMQVAPSGSVVPLAMFSFEIVEACIYESIFAPVYKIMEACMYETISATIYQKHFCLYIQSQ